MPCKLAASFLSSRQHRCWAWFEDVREGEPSKSFCLDGNEKNLSQFSLTASHAIISLFYPFFNGAHFATLESHSRLSRSSPWTFGFHYCQGAFEWTKSGMYLIILLIFANQDPLLKNLYITQYLCI
jgi:hypothetical protein